MPGTDYVCSYCNERFDTLTGIWLHLDDDHPEEDA